MKTIEQAFLEIIVKRLSDLSWDCKYCPQISICEDQTDGGESRYCLPMIEAAVIGNDTWETEHRKKSVEVANGGKR